MTIGRICVRDVDLAEEHETAQLVAQRMNVRSVGSLVVLDSDKHPTGILTDRDLAMKVVGRGLDPLSVTVAELMSTHPETATESTPIEDALRVMRSQGVRRLPVVDDAGQLVGVVSLDDILGLLAEEFREMGKLLEETSPRRMLGG